MTKTKIDRRSFMKGIVTAGAGLIAGGRLLRRQRSLAGLFWGNSAAVDRAVRDQKLGHVSDERAHAIVNDYMSSSPGRPRVVHVHDGNATGWDFGDSYYGDCVDQDSVNVMVNRGVMELTGTPTVAEAWGALIPDHVPGESIAIKVNMNNGWSCRDSDTVIDGLIHPINGVVRGLQEIGVAAEDIWVYDAIRKIPDRFVNGCLYPDVQFFDQCHRPPGWGSDDPDAIVSFSPTYGPTPPPLRIPDMLVEATYLINMPILKAHDYAGVTLGFKNHI